MKVLFLSFLLIYSLLSNQNINFKLLANESAKVDTQISNYPQSFPEIFSDNDYLQNTEIGKKTISKNIFAKESAKIDQDIQDISKTELLLNENDESVDTIPNFLESKLYQHQNSLDKNLQNELKVLSTSQSISKNVSESAAKPMVIKLYYETDCPFARKWFAQPFKKLIMGSDKETKNTAELYKDYSQMVKFLFIPWGFAWFTNKNEGDPHLEPIWE